MKKHFLAFALFLSLIALPDLAWSSDGFLFGSAGTTPALFDASSHWWGAQVCMTTDGNNHVIPISGGGGGGGSVTVLPNTNGSIVAVTATTTASTITAPANAVGFIIEAESGNTANVRWAAGSTATSSLGMLTEPGRDSGYMPMAKNISVIAISGSQTIDVQWVLSQ